MSQRWGARRWAAAAAAPAVVAALAVALGAAGPALAHHSVSGQFDVSERVTWTGVISSIDWIHLDVTDENGTVTTWALETVPPAMMRRAGLTSAMIRGDGEPVVVVEGLRARGDAEKLGYIHKITYPDGRFYQLGQ
jgi:hypothetical protein